MKAEEFWNPDAIIKDFLFDTNMSVADISKEIGWTQWKTSQRINQLGLGWVRRHNRKLSRGHAALLELMQKLLPGEEIVTEHPVGERLRLDIYCPKFRLAAEYHGRQHFFYSDLFYASKEDFDAACTRDGRKVQLCKEQGIALIVFRFNDKLTEDLVFERMLDAIRTTPYVQKIKDSSFRGNHFYEKMKQKNREYRKHQYRQFKNKRNG